MLSSKAFVSLARFPIQVWISKVQNVFEVMSAAPMYPALNCRLEQGGAVFEAVGRWLNA